MDLGGWVFMERAVLPTGTLLAAMLASGKEYLMKPASSVLAAPFSIGHLQLSLGAFAVAICSVFSVIGYSSLHNKVTALDNIRAGPMAEFGRHLYEHKEREVLRQRGNVYVALFSLTVWAFAWRLKVLYSRRQLAEVRGGRRKGAHWLTRICYLVLGFLALLAADIPMCRLSYNFKLALNVSPVKKELQASPNYMQCADVMLKGSAGRCEEFCEKVKMLSHERLNTILAARNGHVTGRHAAQWFDLFRGAKQEEERIEEMFSKRSCSRVLESVDKSNKWVNAACWFFAALSIMGAMAAFTAIADEPDPIHEDAFPHQD